MVHKIRMLLFTIWLHDRVRTLSAVLAVDMTLKLRPMPPHLESDRLFMILYGTTLAAPSCSSCTHTDTYGESFAPLPGVYGPPSLQRNVLSARFITSTPYTTGIRSEVQGKVIKCSNSGWYNLEVNKVVKYDCWWCNVGCPFLVS